MHGKIICGIFFILFRLTATAQELFPHAEPASTVPKGVSGFRFFYDRYKEQSSGRIKESYHLRYMLGITSKWTVMSTLGISNHHYNSFPTDILQYFFNHHLRTYPPAGYAVEGINVYSKYRFLTLDNYHRHFRMAAFAQGNKSFVAHDSAEPSLMNDNTGYGGGIIATFLIERLGTSLTAGYIHPLLYTQKDIDIRFQSGDAVYLEFSTGYRVWPLEYEKYSDLNINLYAEFTWKQYGKAVVQQHGETIDFAQYAANNPYTYKELIAGSYVDGRFSVQFISNSNSRIDLGVTLALKNRSYNYWAPMFSLQYQTYLYGKKKSRKK
ncbi:MAG: hypothetical protein ACTHJT_07020 [Cytophaga sp.]|uniref:hypothetical protein n=1 Tax=Cytophaga sp. TaxID=29535 RepID=UPI003F81C02E